MQTPPNTEDFNEKKLEPIIPEEDSSPYPRKTPRPYLQLPGEFHSEAIFYYDYTFDGCESENEAEKEAASK